ncbi:MAG: TetR/AcrR family transcriptional regulator C-terminal domain-containing protein [Asticcacaulis sp.]|uniref:TetR/AcrR family transcriptional regulator C-terminal domain-containing protein n=1 Tax=Asticcacaulis sp. TaxID=1872648 RepID=UPI0039E5DDC9
MKLDKSTIIDAALDLLNEVGIDALSTRALAQKLGVQQPALYWHFKNKRALLDALNAAIQARYDTYEPAPDETWQSFFRRNMITFRKALLSVRDGARLHAGTEAEPDHVEQIERLMVFMTRQGIEPADAMSLSIATSRYVVGCVLEEQSEAPSPQQIEALDARAQAFPHVAAALASYRTNSPEVHFLAGLDLLITGFETRHASS